MVCVLCVFCDGGGGRGRFPKPVHCSTSGSNCCFLTCIQFATVCCDPLKVFGVVNKAEVDVFLELSCFFDDPVDVGNYSFIILFIPITVSQQNILHSDFCNVNPLFFLNN